MTFLSEYLKSRYWRAVIIGVNTPPGESWKITLLLIINPLMIALLLAIVILEPDPNSWRIYVGWGVIILLVFALLMSTISTISHYNRHNIDLQAIDPKFRKNPDLGKDFRIAAAAAIILPSAIRYVLGLFGVEL